MLHSACWMLVVLGICHVVFGVLRFRVPLRDAIAEGFVGRRSPGVSEVAALVALATVGHLLRGRLRVGPVSAVPRLRRLSL
ncbi:hypothetical protein BH09MYX1_BH09MYX1_56290 [soil metagenome]